MTYTAIDRYGAIGDMHSAALVGPDGSIDWLCFPRFDSPSVFAAILDERKGGRFRLAPLAAYESHQEYLVDTNVLSTSFISEGGQAEILDFMPIDGTGRGARHEIIRMVRGKRGQVEMSCHFEPRLDYARGVTELTPAPGGVIARQRDARLALASPVTLGINEGVARGTFFIRQDEQAAFVLRWGELDPRPPSECQLALDSTIATWHRIVDDVQYDGRWRNDVRRSVLALHLLLYMPTGALVAAPTTSLPEWIGGARNWDYRFCWVRDASFAFDVLDRFSLVAETARFLTWLASSRTPGRFRLQTMYGIGHEEQLPEELLEHLEGYRGSHPVRVGNAAVDQLQLDIFGELMVACATFQRAGGTLDDPTWAMIEDLVDGVLGIWRLPDRGIWEVRGEKRHFVYSKVMCWLALDRAVALAETLGHTTKIAEWRHARDTIHADVLAHGWNRSVGSFVQYYGAEHTDASLLMLPLVDFLPPTDPRVRATVRRVRQELAVNGFIRRYLPEDTDDGIGAEEGAFTMCTLWLVGCLASIGELDEARTLFERVLALGGTLGLLSEMVEPATGTALGNYPLALTHVSLIHTARHLDLALNLRGNPPAEEVARGRHVRSANA
jgi:GH15 family glucan-1,4-alpha-glucosidase